MLESLIGPERTGFLGTRGKRAAMGEWIRIAVWGPPSIPGAWLRQHLRRSSLGLDEDAAERGGLVNTI
jgi:hypothetical protein